MNLPDEIFIIIADFGNIHKKSDNCLNISLKEYL